MFHEQSSMRHRRVIAFNLKIGCHEFLLFIRTRIFRLRSGLVGRIIRVIGPRKYCFAIFW